MRKSTKNLTDRWLVAGSLDLNGKFNNDNHAKPANRKKTNYYAKTSQNSKLMTCNQTSTRDRLNYKQFAVSVV